MAKSLVIYKSLSGFTKKYAEWVAEELQADLYDAKGFDPAKFAAYQKPMDCTRKENIKPLLVYAQA